jgi:hypothetical protein
MQPLILAAAGPWVTPAFGAAALSGAVSHLPPTAARLSSRPGTYLVREQGCAMEAGPANGMLTGPCVFLMTHNRVFRGGKTTPPPPHPFNPFRSHPGLGDFLVLL